MTMKITVLGTRGIPDVLGGVETHCQHLYPEIVKQSDAKVCVIARSPYVDYKHSQYKGVTTRTVCVHWMLQTMLSTFGHMFDLEPLSRSQLVEKTQIKAKNKF